METKRTKRKLYVISSSEDEESVAARPAKRLSLSQDDKATEDALRNGKIAKLQTQKLKALVEQKRRKAADVKALKKSPKLAKSTRCAKVTLEKIPKIPKIDKVAQTIKKENVQERIDELSSATIKCSKLEPLWADHTIIASEHRISSHIAQNIVNLFKEGNTIPFIARYRKGAIGQMPPEELRNVKNTFEKTLELKQKIAAAFSKISKMGKMNDRLANMLRDARNMDTLEEIYAPYKLEEGDTIRRQIELALENPINSILEGKYCTLTMCIGKAPGFSSISEIEKHLVAALAKKIASSSAVLKFLQKMKKNSCTLITKEICKRIANTKSSDKKGNKQKANKDGSNFVDYYDRSFNTSSLKPHQIMAINRAEHLKFIKVQLEFEDFFQTFQTVAKSAWQEVYKGNMSTYFDMALEESYKTIALPLLRRLKRNELKSFAEIASLEIFSGNLKQILLATPVKGRKILGVDPGFAFGCKLAVISDTGSLLATGIVHPHTQKNLRERHEKTFRKMLIDHNCSLIALGNGAACRETETWITDMIHRKLFRPLEVSYTIVNESGASVYSCSAEALKEFKNLDPNKISAVSLARRVQEPLAELVKIDPKHLGIGMYQHDVNQKRLEEALAEVVSECVSFVGIDLNTASQCLLKYVAGLSDRKASEIIAFREENGPFESRDELMKVKGIGPHTFKQCAGFLKVLQSSNKLDATIVHPESYGIAGKVIKHLDLKVAQIGEDGFMERIREEQANVLTKFADFNTKLEDLESVMEGLSKPLNYDLRHDGGARKPLFRKGITSVSELSVDMVLAGVVNNVTSFGYFVDIGVGQSGLLHSNYAKGNSLLIGDHVEVMVRNLELIRGRIGLELVQKL